MCNKGFQMVDAMAFCKSMGYSCALSASSAEQQGIEPHAIQLTYDIMMSNVECEEGAFNLTQCNYDLVHDCDHTNDVYLTCGRLNLVCLLIEVLILQMDRREPCRFRAFNVRIITHDYHFEVPARHYHTN